MELRKDYEKAVSYYKKALEIQMKTMGDNHSDVAVAFGNISVAYMKMNEFTKAKNFAKKSIDVLKKTLGEDHPTTALAYNILFLDGVRLVGP